jgi:hypothetical protein
VELRKAATIERLQREVAEEQAALQPGDDQHVDPVNTPFPLNAATLFRVLLLIDAGLVLFLGARAPNRGTPRSIGGARWKLNSFGAEWPLIAAMTALAAVLRIIGSARDLWIDEITTLVRHVRGPVADVFLQATSSNNHLLNSLLGHVTVWLFGEHAWALRVPAILFGIATVPVLYLLTRQFSPRVEAAFATVVLAVSYHHVFFSTDARGYSAMLFGALLATFALMDALETDSLWSWSAYLAGMVICVAAVATGVVVLAGQAVAVTLLRPRRRFFITVLLTGWILLHVYAFLIPDILGIIFGDYQRPEAGWHLSSALADIFLRGLRLGPIALPVLIAGGAILLAGIYSYLRKSRMLALLLLLPLAIMLVIVIALHAGIYPRFFLFGLPGVILFAARGVRIAIERLPFSFRRLGWAAGFAGVLVVSAYLLRVWWSYPKQDYSGARRYVAARMAPADAVVAVGIAGEGYRYYWPETPVSNRLSEIERLMTENKRVWLLYSFPDDMERRRPILIHFVKQKFDEVRVFPGMVIDGEIRVCLYPPGS